MSGWALDRWQFINWQVSAIFFYEPNSMFQKLSE